MTRTNCRYRVLSAIKRAGLRGLTDEEIQVRLGMDGNTERPRRRELEESGKVRKSGDQRKTRSGHFASVWVAA